MPSSFPGSPSSASTALESDVEISDVSSLQSSEDAVDLSVSGWTDLGSNSSVNGGQQHSRQPTEYSFGSSVSSDGDDDETTSTFDDHLAGDRSPVTGLGVREDNRSVEANLLSGSFMDLESSLHSDPTLSSSSASSRTAQSVKSFLCSTSTQTIDLRDTPSPASGSPIGRSSSLDLVLPDPATVASSFSSVSGGGGSSFRSNPPLASSPRFVSPLNTTLRDNNADPVRPASPSRRVSSRSTAVGTAGISPTLAGPRGVRSGPAFARAASQRLIQHQQHLASFASNSSPPLLTAIPFTPDSAQGSASSSVAPRQHPLFIQIVYLGPSPPAHLRSPLLHTLLNLLHTSLASTPSDGDGDAPMPATLRQYDLLGGSESIRSVQDIREPFRPDRGSAAIRRMSSSRLLDEREKKSGKGAGDGVLRVQVGDLTLDEGDEAGAERDIREHLHELATASTAASTSFLFVAFQQSLGASSSSFFAASAQLDVVASEFKRRDLGFEILPALLGGGGSSEVVDAISVEDVLRLRGPEDAARVWGLALRGVQPEMADATTDAKEEQEPMIRMKVDWPRLRRWTARYLVTVLALSTIYIGALAGLGSLPDSFDDLAILSSLNGQQQAATAAAASKRDMSLLAQSSLTSAPTATLPLGDVLKAAEKNPETSASSSLAKVKTKIPKPSAVASVNQQQQQQQTGGSLASSLPSPSPISGPTSLAASLIGRDLIWMPALSKAMSAVRDRTRNGRSLPPPCYPPPLVATDDPSPLAAAGTEAPCIDVAWPCSTALIAVHTNQDLQPTHFSHTRPALTTSSSKGSHGASAILLTPSAFSTCSSMDVRPASNHGDPSPWNVLPFSSPLLLSPFKEINLTPRTAHRAVQVLADQLRLMKAAVMPLLSGALTRFHHDARAFIAGFERWRTQLWTASVQPYGAEVANGAREVFRRTRRGVRFSKTLGRDVVEKAAGVVARRLKVGDDQRIAAVVVPSSPTTATTEEAVKFEDKTGLIAGTTVDLRLALIAARTALHEFHRFLLTELEAVQRPTKEVVRSARRGLRRARMASGRVVGRAREGARGVRRRVGEELMRQRKMKQVGEIV